MSPILTYSWTRIIEYSTLVKKVTFCRLVVFAEILDDIGEELEEMLGHHETNEGDIGDLGSVLDQTVDLLLYAQDELPKSHIVLHFKKF